MHHKTDPADPACQRHGGRHDHQQGRRRTSQRLHRRAATPPSPTTASYASGTSPSGSSLPRPRRIPTKWHVH